MSDTLRILLIAMSLLGLAYIISRIRNSKMQIEYALFWIFLGIAFIVMAIFPQTMYWLTVHLGVMSTANLVYLLIISILLVKVFMMTIQLSVLENKIKDLVQQIGISEKIQQDEKKEKKVAEGEE